MVGAHTMLMNSLFNIYGVDDSSLPGAWPCPVEIVLYASDRAQMFVEYALQCYAVLPLVSFPFCHLNRLPSKGLTLRALCRRDTIQYMFKTDTIVAEHKMLHTGVEKPKGYLVSPCWKK